MKFPVNFPVSRELRGGDRFECDCVRHHAVRSAHIVSNAATKTPNRGAFAGLRSARRRLCRYTKPPAAPLGPFVSGLQKAVPGSVVLAG